MNKYLSVVLGVLFFVPSVSFAASLTQAQAESLINIVQASPGTPASAFTGLITAFSNITVTQAESLINVIQVSPGTPSSAFVNLLESFTQDAQSVGTTQSSSQGTEPVATTPTTPALTISLGSKSTTADTAHIEWDTSIPSDSKIFVTLPPAGSPQVIPSASGTSTHHFVDLTGLAPSVRYNYTIEAVAGEQDQQLSGWFVTMPAPQFTQTPIWTGVVDGSFSGTWATNIPATAALYVSATQGDVWHADVSQMNSAIDVQKAQTWDEATTTFSITVPAHTLPVFYAVVITANGQNTIYYGSDYHSDLPQ